MIFLEDAFDTDAERLGRDGLDGLIVMLDRPLLELAKELMRPSSLVIVGSLRAPNKRDPHGGSSSDSTRARGLVRQSHQ